jgi:hypothetical protein
LSLKGLTKETKNENIFISIEKYCIGNYISYYKKKFYQDALVIADYLSAIMQRQYEKEIIYIFDLHYKELAKDII